jgi:hypothetical protein
MKGRGRRRGQMVYIVQGQMVQGQKVEEEQSVEAQVL